MIFNKVIKSIANKYDCRTHVTSFKKNDIATLRLLKDEKEAYVYFVYIDNKYRPYSISLDIVPNSIYDDLINHDKSSLKKRESSIAKNLELYFSSNVVLGRTNRLLFNYSYALLDIDGVPQKIRVPGSRFQGRTLESKN